MIRLSSGKPIRKDKDGNRIFGDSKVHTVLLLLLLCRAPSTNRRSTEASLRLHTYSWTSKFSCL
jgi:hypothetical protein